jgi:hypothetical protein
MFPKTATMKLLFVLAASLSAASAWDFGFLRGETTAHPLEQFSCTLSGASTCRDLRMLNLVWGKTPALASSGCFTDDLPLLSFSNPRETF